MGESFPKCDGHMSWRRNIDSGERYKDCNVAIKRVTNKYKFKIE